MTRSEKIGLTIILKKFCEIEVWNLNAIPKSLWSHSTQPNYVHEVCRALWRNLGYNAIV